MFCQILVAFFLVKDRLVKILSSYNFKYCQKAQVFSQGPLKLSCALVQNNLSYKYLSPGYRDIEQGDVSLCSSADRGVQGQLRTREEEQAHVLDVGSANAFGKKTVS